MQAHHTRSQPSIRRTIGRDVARIPKKLVFSDLGRLQDKSKFISQRNRVSLLDCGYILIKSLHAALGNA